MQALCKLLCLVAAGMVMGCATKSPEEEWTPPERYFGDGELEPSYPDIDDLQRRWFSQILRWMREPTLAFATSELPPTCRFLYLRSFDPAICVRVARHPDGLQVTSTVLAIDFDGDVPRPLFPAQRAELIVRDSVWETLRERLDEPGLWLPQGSTEEELFTFDGAQWILELRDGETYQLVHRHSPEADGPYAEFRKLCLELFTIAGVLSEVYQVAPAVQPAAAAGGASRRG